MLSCISLFSFSSNCRITDELWNIKSAVYLYSTPGRATVTRTTGTSPSSGRYVPPTMTFLQNISAYTLGILTDKDLPNIAMIGLEEGYDSESLRILAGHNSSDNPFQLVSYFNCVQKELDLSKPDRKSALIVVLKFYATKIVSKMIDPYLGFEAIQNTINTTEFYYDDVDLMKCYADYISIWEVKSDGLRLHEGLGLTKDEFIDRTKQELANNLSKWLTETGGT